MPPKIHRPDLQDEVLTAEGCWILESWNVAVDNAVSIARARVTPGVTTEPHRLHGVVERYVIQSGQGLVRVGDLPPTRVVPDDVVAIPAGISQQITNDGDTDLIFLCVCTPRFTPECYEALA